MLIVCPNCATSYDVEVASLRPNGRRVRCVRCRTVWLAELSHADKVVAAAESLAPVRRAVEAVAAAVAEDAAPDSPNEPPEAWPDTETDRPADIAATMATDAQADEIPGHDVLAAGQAAAGDALEVESPPIAPADPDADYAPGEADLTAEAAPFENIESVAARRASRAKRGDLLRWPLTQMQSVILALILIDAIVVGWRADLVRLLPQTASFYSLIGLPVNLRGLNFDNLATSTEQRENVPILVVEGVIVNDSRKMAEVPHLRFAVRNAAHQEIYSWTAPAPRPTLPHGEAVGFRTRLASPPPDAHDVLVRFLNRTDIMNGSR